MSPTPAPSTALIDPVLLDHLLRAGAPVSVDTLSNQLGVTREHVVRELERLRQAGCVIEAHPQLGPALSSSGLGAWVDYVQWACPLPGRDGPRRVQLYQRTTSTQDAVRRIVEELGHAADGAVVIADEQTAGRGRLGRRWIAPAGSAVLFTRASVWSDPDTAPTVDRITFATSVAVAQAIQAVAGSPPLDVKIKWPNDVLVDGRKIAGILVESFTSTDAQANTAALIGVGINTGIEADQMPQDMHQQITSLSMCGRRVDRLCVLTETLRQMDHALMQADLADLMAAWRRRCAVLSQRVRLRTDGKTIHGQVIDLDPYQGLIVRTDDGTMLHLPAATTTIM